MIRDFCKITRDRLIDEIKALTKAVEEGTADRAITSESVKAIDHVRSLGNSGAHMEKDIDLIVPVDGQEAEIMTDLIEMLFDDWYGERERRRLRLTKIEEIKVEKDLIRRGETGAAPVATPRPDAVSPAIPAPDSAKDLTTLLSHPFTAPK